MLWPSCVSHLHGNICFQEVSRGHSYFLLHEFVGHDLARVVTHQAIGQSQFIEPLMVRTYFPEWNQSEHNSPAAMAVVDF